MGWECTTVLPKWTALLKHYDVSTLQKVVLTATCISFPYDKENDVY